MVRLKKSVKFGGINYAHKYNVIDIVELYQMSKDDTLKAIIEFYNGVLPPEVDESVQYYRDFMSGFDERPKPKHGKSNGAETTDFYSDLDLIYTAILREFHINIYKDDVHWFEFLWMVRDLQDKSLYKEVCFARTGDKSKLDKDKRPEYTRLKMMYPIMY